MTIGEQSDEALVLRVRNGEREMFSVLVDRYKRGIASFIGATVRSPADVADLSQEAFLRAYAHLSTFNPSLGKFSGWMYQIARNVVRTHLGKSQRRVPLSELPEDQTLENALPDLSRDGDPEATILRDEAESELRAALADLPERTRTVLTLRYYNNMEYHTIAKTLDLSLGNVKTLIHRGKIALAQKMLEKEKAKHMSPSIPRGSSIRQNDKAGDELGCHPEVSKDPERGEGRSSKGAKRALLLV